MQPGAMLYQGKSKQVFATQDPERVLLRFTDRATAFNGVKEAQISDKGRINCAISARLFREVGDHGVAHHVVSQVSENELLCARVEIVPIEVVVRNRAAGGFTKRYAVAEGTRFAEPLVELFVKSDTLNDPLIVDDAAVLLGYAKRWELAFLRETSLHVHAVLSAFYASAGIELVDAKYEFGRAGGRLLLADELTPDGARLWDTKTGARLDKDVFRRDLGDLGDTYRALHARLFG